VYCEKLLDLLAGAGFGVDGLEETRLVYGFTRLSNGDADAWCEASLGSLSTSHRAYYPSITDGARLGQCITPADYPPNGNVVGFWSFQRSAGSVSAMHADPDPGQQAVNGISTQFSDSECSAFRMDGKQWVRVALRDAP
jgi:hypothetical protein